MLARHRRRQTLARHQAHGGVMLPVTSRQSTERARRIQIGAHRPLTNLPFVIAPEVFSPLQRYGSNLSASTMPREACFRCAHGRQRATSCTEGNLQWSQREVLRLQQKRLRSQPTSIKQQWRKPQEPQESW